MSLVFTQEQITRERREAEALGFERGVQAVLLKYLDLKWLVNVYGQQGAKNEFERRIKEFTEGHTTPSLTRAEKEEA